MDELDISGEINFMHFSLTSSGEPISLSEFALRMCVMSKTQVFLLEDFSQLSIMLPKDKSYVDEDAGFNDYIFGHFEKNESSPAWSNFHYFFDVDIYDSILPSFKELKSDG